MSWDTDKAKRRIAAETRERIADAAYLRDLQDAANARTRFAAPATPQPHRVPEQPSKAQMRAEGAEAVAAWEQTHPPPAPWGPWSEWRTVTRADGSTYKERDRRRISNDR